MKYDVSVYHTVRTKLEGIEASSHDEAMQIAEMLMKNIEVDRRANIRITEDGHSALWSYTVDDEGGLEQYLVDEEGDPEYNNSRIYDHERKSWTDRSPKWPR